MLKVQENVYGPTHQRVAMTLNSLGEMAVRRGDLPAAEADFTRAVSINRAQLGDPNVNTAVYEGNLGAVYLKESRNLLAETTLKGVVSVIAALPPGNNLIGTVRARWGRSLLALRRYQEAERELSLADTLLKSQRNPPPEEVANVRHDLAALYAATHQIAKASSYQTSTALYSSSQTMH